MIVCFCCEKPKMNLTRIEFLSIRGCPVFVCSDCKDYNIEKADLKPLPLSKTNSALDKWDKDFIKGKVGQEIKVMFCLPDGFEIHHPINPSKLKAFL